MSLENPRSHKLEESIQSAMPLTSSGDPPPTYEDALQLPSGERGSRGDNGGSSSSVEPTGSSSFRLRRQSSSFMEQKRRLSIEEGANENEEADADTSAVVESYGLRDNDDADESYSMEDEAFEPYEDDTSGEFGTSDRQQEAEEEETSQKYVEDYSAKQLVDSSDEIQASLQFFEPTRRPKSQSSPQRPPSRGKASSPLGSSSSIPALAYDEQTYSIVSKLRALNRQLSTKVDLQAKQIRSLQDEKKLDTAKIQTLERDLRMLKQTMRNVQNAGSFERVASVRIPEKRPSEDQPPSYASLVSPGRQQQAEGSSRLELPHVSTVPQPPPRSPRVLATEATRPRTSPRKIDSSPRSPSTVSAGSPLRRSIHTAPAASSSTSSATGDKLLAAKVEKLEQDKRDLQHRHAHQLANYSHELSRLERQIESAQKLVQAKDYELRLQKSRHLYANCASPGATSGTAIVGVGKDGTHRHHHYSTMLSDALWRELMPSTPPASTMLALPFTSHVGLAFEQLLGHQLLSFHDHMVDATTRDWLHEIRRCGFQVLNLHHDFQCMALTFKKLAECTHIYDLAETFTKEVKQLTKAEQAFLYVMDPAENEFWCRIPRNQEEPNTKDMITVRSRVLPISGIGGVSAVAAEHTGTTAQHTAMLAAATSASHVPCGLASWVFHSKKPLLIPAGHATKNPHYSTAPDSTDRLMHFKSASTLLLPIIHGTTTLGVIQVCGKLTQVAALGVSISLEKCEAFTLEDQAYLTMLGHFLSGILPKAAYFTEVESNKVNEETLIQLAPEIFTCLRFEELGKIVIQNAKEILDADRCSLFVADNDDRMLFNWQSDISGKGGVEVVNDVKKSTMRIPFGHGIVGMVAETKELINIPDAYEDSRFNSSWDKKSNYRTKSILTVPILTTLSSKTKAPIRRRRSQHDVYGSVIIDESPTKNGKADQHHHAEPQQTLLGVVQVINKSGGAPFRSKDEFLLQTISKLIALAIENSQLFQKTQELCASLGKLIADADLVEAVATLGSCAEDIIGVESAAIYILAPEQGGGGPGVGQTELFTFHRKRRHKIVVKEQMYRHSLLEKALRTRELVIVNELSPSTPNYNAYVDSIGGITARNVLFMPLLIDDPEDATQTTKKLIGMLHLVNTRGRKVKFERFDLFLSIVSSQTCSVLASILEKQAIMRQQEQTRHLLDTTLSFFKEMSPVGIINAVYNTCSSLFGVEKAHLFLWEPDRRAMWTAKLSPNAESVSAAMTTTAMNDSSTGSSSGMAISQANGSGHHLTSRAPSLRTQARRISVLTDQKITVPTNEGLLEHVLGKSSMVVVKHWVDGIEETNENDHDQDEDHDGNNIAVSVNTRRTSRKVTITPGSSTSISALELSKYMMRASRSDQRAGFTKHAVVACPVWDFDGLEVVGIVVLFFPKGRAPSPGELTNLPLLSRQISGALNVCDDLRAVTQRSRKLQDIVELYHSRKVTSVHAMSFTLSSRGQLLTFSQPMNIGTPSFAVSSLLQVSSSVASTANHHTLELHKLPLDEDGHRWVFVLSGANLQDMTSEHFVNWVGKDVSSGAAAGVFDKLRTDLQSVYVRKESVKGVVSLPASQQPKAVASASPSSTPLPRAVQLQLRLMLWEFVDAQQWKVDVKQACKLFDAVDPTRSRLISRHHLEYALTTNGRNVELDQLEWDLLHAQFADPETDLIHVERMFHALAPQFKVLPSFQYELTPVLDGVTQSVVNVHVLLTASKPTTTVSVAESAYV